MGRNLCGFRENNVRRSSSKQDCEFGLAASIMNFIKPKYCCTAGRRRKGPLHHEEKKHHLSKNTGVQLVTLEEWILASPRLNILGKEKDQFQVSKQASKRVHPSFDRTQKGCTSKSSRERFSKERSCSMKYDQAERREFEDSSFCRSQGGKLKKKVSFRLPEVADVFILDSPEEITNDNV